MTFCKNTLKFDFKGQKHGPMANRGSFLKSVEVGLERKFYFLIINFTLWKLQIEFLKIGILLIICVGRQ